MEVAGLGIAHLIIGLVLIRRYAYMVGVEHIIFTDLEGWLYIPQPAGTGAGTTGQLGIPTCATIDIERGITIAIGIDSLSGLCHHAVTTVFLIELNAIGKLQHIGLACLARLIEEIASIEVQRVVHIVCDIDDIVRRCLCDTGDYCWTINKDERHVRCSRSCLYKGIGIPVMVDSQRAAPRSRKRKSVSIRIRDIALNDIVRFVYQRIRKGQDNGVGGNRHHVSPVLQRYLFVRGINSVSSCQDKIGRFIGGRQRTVIRKILVRCDIPHRNEVRIVAIEIPEVRSVRDVCSTIGFNIGLRGYGCSFVVFKILTVAVLQVKGTAAAEFHEFAGKLVRGIGHIDIGSSRWCCRDTVVRIDFAGIEVSFPRIEHNRLVIDIRALKGSRDRAISTQWRSWCLLDSLTAY